MRKGAVRARLPTGLCRAVGRRGIGAACGVRPRTPPVSVVIAAGLDPVKVLHRTLRHTAIAQLVLTLVNIPTAQKFSGHKTLAMVLKYAHANTAHVPVSLDKLEARYKKGVETVAPPAESSPLGGGLLSQPGHSGETN